MSAICSINSRLVCNSSCVCLRFVISRISHRKLVASPSRLSALATETSAGKDSPLSGFNISSQVCICCNDLVPFLISTSSFNWVRNPERACGETNINKGFPIRNSCCADSSIPAVRFASLIIPDLSVTRYPSGAKLNKS